MSAYTWKSATLVLMGIVLGCGAGAVGGAIAQQEPEPGSTATGAATRYQYTCIKEQNAKIWEPDAQAMLNRMGGQGWRLLESRYAAAGPGPYMDVYCFERASR